MNANAVRKPLGAARTSLRAVLYLRQSISRDDSVSLELQESLGRAYCERIGASVVAVISDPNRTGRTLKRRSVQETIGYIERGEADIVVVWKWSRLARNRKDFAVTCDYVEGRGGRIESSTEPIDTSTAAGRFQRGMMAELAAFESERIGEDWQNLHQSRRLKGLPAQGGDRYGYVRDGNEFRIKPDTGPILRSMYLEYIGGRGFTWIATMLNRQGHRLTSTGGPFIHTTVRKILDSGFGAGLIIHGKPPDATYHQGAHEGVISGDEWRRYLDRRARFQRPDVPRVHDNAAYVLSGLLFCGDCGYRMHVNNLGMSVGYGYICWRWFSAREGQCVTVSRKRAESAVLAWLEDIATEVEDAADQVKIVDERLAATRASIKDFTRRIDALDRQLEKLALGWSTGRIDDDPYERARAQVTAERDSLVQQRADAERAAAHAPVVMATTARSLLDEWDTLPVTERRDILGSLIRRVVVHGGRLGPIDIEPWFPVAA